MQLQSSTVVHKYIRGYCLQMLIMPEYDKCHRTKDSPPIYTMRYQMKM